jgi:hypothetical protein
MNNNTATEHTTDRRCEVCGCTDNNACLSSTTGPTCAWFTETLCTFCALRRGRAAIDAARNSKLKTENS